MKMENQHDCMNECILELGKIAFLISGDGDLTRAKHIDDVNKLFLLLLPEDGTYHLMEISEKRFPVPGAVETSHPAAVICTDEAMQKMLEHHLHGDSKLTLPYGDRKEAFVIAEGRYSIMISHDKKHPHAEHHHEKEQKSILMHEDSKGICGEHHPEDMPLEQQLRIHVTEVGADAAIARLVYVVDNPTPVSGLCSEMNICQEGELKLKLRAEGVTRRLRHQQDLLLKVEKDLEKSTEMTEKPSGAPVISILSNSTDSSEILQPEQVQQNEQPVADKTSSVMKPSAQDLSISDSSNVSVCGSSPEDKAPLSAFPPPLTASGPPPLHYFSGTTTTSNINLPEKPQAAPPQQKLAAVLPPVASHPDLLKPTGGPIQPFLPFQSVSSTEDKNKPPIESVTNASNVDLTATNATTASTGAASSVASAMESDLNAALQRPLQAMQNTTPAPFKTTLNADLAAQFSPLNPMQLQWMLLAYQQQLNLLAASFAQSQSTISQQLNKQRQLFLESQIKALHACIRNQSALLQRQSISKAPTISQQQVHQVSSLLEQSQANSEHAATNSSKRRKLNSATEQSAEDKLNTSPGMSRQSSITSTHAMPVNMSVHLNDEGNGKHDRSDEVRAAPHVSRSSSTVSNIVLHNDSAGDLYTGITPRQRAMRAHLHHEDQEPLKEEDEVGANEADERDVVLRDDVGNATKGMPSVVDTSKPYASRSSSSHSVASTTASHSKKPLSKKVVDTVE
eukprot:GDKJ01036229.1.p1 GENE.GDKJ01036229.1~~GDKJ01036229.1.p1  ORF type:complete len:736 (+),score=160.26 GDKJ01036229.1:178-2385(+)